MSERLVIVAHIVRALLFLLLEAQRARADSDAVAVFKRMLVARLAIDEDLVGAASHLAADDGAVNDCKDLIVEPDVCVMARSARVIQHDVVIRRAPNRALGLRNQIELPLATTGICDFQ